MDIIKFIMKNTACKFGLHKFKDDDKVFYHKDYENFSGLMFSQTCKYCGQKSLLRCFHFGWAGVTKKRELVPSYNLYLNRN